MPTVVEADPRNPRRLVEQGEGHQSSPRSDGISLGIIRLSGDLSVSWVGVMVAIEAARGCPPPHPLQEAW